MLLVDKYSPKRIEDLLGNQDVVSLLAHMKDNFPHLLLTGPPGTGKTTAAHIIRQSFNFLELNASDERGIDTIRTTLKNFCNKSIPNKLVILDECDHLTAAAQQALRRTMETTSTKFMLICNQMSQVIEPIQSRCAVLRFDRISTADFAHRIREICGLENIKLTESGHEALASISGGDLRACLNCLQPLVNIKKTVDDEFLYKLNGIPNFKVLELILESIRMRDIGRAVGLFEDLWKMKFEGSDFLDGFSRVAKGWNNYEVMKVIGKYHLKVNEGVNSKIQFYSMFNDINKLF